MKRRVYYVMITLLFLSAMGAKAQVTIGSQNDPHPGAVLDLQSTSKGLLLPNVSLSDVNILTVVASPTAADNESARGMLVYNTNASTTGGNGIGIYVWDGAKWQLGDSQSGGLPGTPDTWVTVDPTPNQGNGTVGNPYINVCPGTTVTLTSQAGYSFGTVIPSSAATVSGNSVVFNATGSVVVTKDGQSGIVSVAISNCVTACPLPNYTVLGGVYTFRNSGYFTASGTSLSDLLSYFTATGQDLCVYKRDADWNKAHVTNWTDMASNCATGGASNAYVDAPDVATGPWRLPTIPELGQLGGVATSYNFERTGTAAHTGYWSSQDQSASVAWYWNFNSTANWAGTNPKGYGFSVRCVRNIN